MPFEGVQEANVQRELTLDKYHFLDIYTVGQGNGRICIAFVVAFWLLFTGLYFVIFNLLPNDVEDADTRDMFDDWRLTLPGVQNHHELFEKRFAGGVEVSVGSVSAMAAMESSGEGNILDPRFGIKSGVLYMSGSGYTQFRLKTTVTVDSPSFALPVPTALLGVLNTNVEVPWYQFRADYDERTAIVMDLYNVTVRIASFGGDFFIHEVIPAYGEVWKGMLDQATSVTGDRKSIPIIVVDVSMPMDRGWPAFSGFSSGFWPGLFFFIASLLSTCPLCYLRYLVSRNYAMNAGLPPPFFQSMSRFRGW